MVAADARCFHGQSGQRMERCVRRHSFLDGQGVGLVPSLRFGEL